MLQKKSAKTNHGRVDNVEFSKGKVVGYPFRYAGQVQGAVALGLVEVGPVLVALHSASLHLIHVGA